MSAMPPTGSPTPVAARSRIVVVDDEPGMQNSVRRILGRVHEVNVASSGPEALELLARQPHDLAIVDVRMPGMNGFEVLKAIKTRFPDTEVIIMTGSISNPEAKLVEALRERAFYFISKPFEKAVLETLVDRCLELQQLEREKRAWTAELESHLEQARRFQRMLLPRRFPTLAGLQGAVHYEPSEGLSGDFYDFHDVGRGRLAVLIADVSGHGVSAALYTGMVKSEMLTVRDESAHLDRLFASINERLGVSVRRRYVTALLVLLDVRRQRVRYVNAGHPGFITGDGRVWESTGPPLGMLAGATYEVREVALQPGDRMLLYTDGLSEAMRDDGSEFGLERIREVFLAGRDAAPAAAVDAIAAAARQFTARERFADDATAILLQLDG
jgi:serine phosphatase RsbU (regulator of sigma subunit)